MANKKDASEGLLTKREFSMAAVACRLRAETCEENNEMADAREWWGISFKLMFHSGELTYGQLLKSQYGLERRK